MDNYIKPSEWCARWQNEALERGDVDAAMRYFEMFNLWIGRGL